MRGFFQLVTSWPKSVLAIAAATALVLGANMFRLTREVDPDAFIPRGHAALVAKQRVDQTFGLGDPIVIGVIRDEPGGIFTPATLRLIRELTRTIQQWPELESGRVISIATESGVYFDRGLPGFELLMRGIPKTDEALAALRDDILGYELYRGTLVAGDGSAACILVEPSDSRRADALYRKLTLLLESPAITKLLTNHERLVVAGEAAVRAHMGTAVSDDALRMNFICPVVMAFLILFAYRTVRGTLLPLCVIGGASAWSLGLMAAVGVPIYIVTNGIFVIIMALGVADSLHLLGQYYEEQLEPAGRTRQSIIVDACLAMWYPLLITTLTDVAGFFALFLVGRMPPVRYFGLFTCVGVLGALAFSYTVVPAGLAMVPLKMSGVFRRRKTRAGSPQRLNWAGGVLATIGRIMFHRRRAVLVVGAATIALAVFAASKMTVNDARIFAFADDHPIVVATREFNTRFDGTSNLNITLTTAEGETLLTPEVLRRIESLEAFTETLPHVGGTHSLAGWVKSAHQRMHDNDPAFFAIPDDPDQTRYYLDVLRDPRTSPMADLLAEVIDDTYTRTNLIVRMQSSEFVHQREVIHRIEAYLDERFNDKTLRVELSGRAHLDYHWLEMVRSTHINSVGLTVACVFVLTGVMFRSVWAGLLCTLTVGMAVLVNYAIMGLSGIPLGVGTSMFASIAIGAGVNFPIHILDRLRHGLSTPVADPAEVFADTLAFTGRALLFTAFVVAAGFLLLCVSEFRTLVRFGLLIGIAMMVSFTTSVTLLPAAVAAFKPRFVWRR